jgi:hypothetical protein
VKVDKGAGGDASLNDGRSELARKVQTTMTVSVLGSEPLGGLLLVAMGTRPELAALDGAAARLTAPGGLILRRLDRTDDPDAALCTLADPGFAGPPTLAGGWLAALPVDPGLPLAGGGSWAEALGAWRQPTLLLVSEAQLATGLPAAGAALLLRWQVPLVGMIQAGSPWSPEERRRDGLPWLGWLPPGDEEEDPEALRALLMVVQRRWHRIKAA